MTVPASYDDCDIIFSAGAFENCVSLEVLNIPDTVRSISTTNDGYRTGTGAFAGCSNLKEVNIYATGDEADPQKEVAYFSADGVLFHKLATGDDVELIYYPYAKTTATYTIPSTVSNEYECEWDYTPVTHNVTTIPTRVFRERKFTEIVISSTVTSIACQAFYNNTALTKVTFEAGGTASLTISDDAFYGCTYVAEVTLPARYDDFNAWAFSDCSSLTNVYIEAGGTYTSDSGVLLDSDGTTLVYFPNARSGAVVTANITTGNITKIGDGAFAYNSNITSVTISADVTEIGEGAFEDCTAVSSLVFEGVADSGALTIKSRAFYGCVLVSEVRLPANLRVLEADAFGGCTSLTSVYFDSFVNATSDDLSFADGAFGTTNYITKVEFGANVPLIENFGDVFDGGRLTEVVIATENTAYYSDSDSVLYNAQKTTILYYPRSKEGAYTLLSTTTNIGSNVFSNRVNLTAVTIGAGVNTIGDDAFSGCTYLTAIYVDPDNENYGNVYTYDADGTTVIGSDGILYAKDVASGDLTELVYCPIRCLVTDIEVVETVVKTAGNAFENNVTVQTVKFTTTSSFELGTYTFSGSSVESVILPETITTISSYAFYNCKSLVYVNLPDSVTTIGTCAFRGCTSLVGDLSYGYVEGEKGIKLNEGLVTIGASAFRSDYFLAVTIPSTVTVIDDLAFYYCWSEDESEAEIVFAESEDPDNEVNLVIYDSAFYGAEKATAVTIPKRVVFIDVYAFGCFGDMEVDPKFNFDPDCQITTISDSMFEFAAIESIVLPKNVTTIESWAFYFCDMLKSISFAPDGCDSKVEFIGMFAFYGSGITSLTIPASVEEIEYYAFDYCDYLEDVTFEAGSKVDVIDEYTFADSSELKTVTLPGSVESLGYSAFGSCSSLETVSFVEGEEIKLTTIGKDCFEYDSSLETIAIPSTVKTIDNYAFFRCTSLSKVDFGEESSITKIGYAAFYQCSLTEFVIPDRCPLNYIDYEAFGYCSNLESFTFPESTASSIDLGEGIFYASGVKSVKLSTSVTNIGDAFLNSSLTNIEVADSHPVYKTDESNEVLYTDTSIEYVCKEITSESIFIPEGIVSIGTFAFARQTAVKSVSIPASVAEIGSYAFYGCTALETVTIASGSSLSGSPFGESAFDSCTSLKSINLPDSVTGISDYCFDSCDLSETTIPSTILSVGQYAFQGTQITSLDLTSMQTIGSAAFYGMEKLTSVTLGSSLTEIGTSGFNGCTSLTTISLPDSLATLGTYAFRNCTSLESIKIPGNVKSIGNYTFAGCSELVNIELPDGVTSIGTYAFQNCVKLGEIILPEELTSIGNYAFSGCSALEACVLPEDVATLGTNAFEKCVSLTGVILPGALTSIGANCFQGCTALESIEFNDKLTTVGNYAFEGCTSLAVVVLGPSVTSVGTYVFQNCTSLTYAYTGNLLTSLGNYMFAGCEKLDTVEFGTVLNTIGTYAFQNCTSLCDVVFPASLTMIGEGAFASCVSLETLFIPSSVSSVAVSAFSSCTCAIYVDNTLNYVSTYWTSTWSTGFGGTVYYYSESEPSQDGNSYWHYDESGDITVWDV